MDQNHRIEPILEEEEKKSMGSDFGKLSNKHLAIEVSAA
jgi:hypothetical protein